MRSDFDNDLLREGILRYKSGERDAARRYIERALDNADDQATRAQANYYLSLLADDPETVRHHLEETLAIDLTHAEARRALAILDGRLKPAEIVNPDALPAPDSAGALQADRFTCPKCGGRRVFAPDGAALVCEFCQQQESLASGRLAPEQDFFVAMATARGHRAPVLAQVFRCAGCGAEFMLPPGEASATCAFCASIQVVALERSRELLAPDAIIPMAFGQAEAAGKLAAWTAGHKLRLSEELQPRGLYLPVWTFDLLGSLPWSGKVARGKQVVAVSGEKSLQFDDLCLPAARPLAGLLEKTLGEYSLSTTAPYDPRFLAGWPLLVQEGSMAEAALEARRRAVEQARALIQAEYGHVLDLRYSTAGLTIHSYRLVLVPAWVCSYQFEERSYSVLVNGLFGSVHGELPARSLYGFLGGLLGG